MVNDVLKRLVDTHFEKIRKAKYNNKLIVFVGSGVSANSKLPTWYELVSEFSKEIGIVMGNSMESFLQIPQYYYNERGEKEYNDKISDVFNRNTYRPNPIHKQIMELNPRHIVTTNYDDLLEKSTKLYNKSYHVVANNSDLPYSSQDQMIIKMHGCLSKKNIVLKEDDYLSYSKNFKLIETFIKSLFSTHLVLFVGFSADDPNFKLVFQWVKDILSKDFQPAYLIDVNEDFNLIKYNYYKNRGINIIYTNNIKEIDSETSHGEIKLEHDKGKKLYSVLHSINNIQKNLNDVIDNIYDSLQEFQNVNALLPKDIIRATNYQEELIYDFFGDSKLYFLRIDSVLYNLMMKIIGNGQTKVITRKYRRELLVKHKERLKFILSILKKANIKGINFRVGNSNWSLSWQPNIVKSNYVELEYAFNFKAIVEESIRQSKIQYYDHIPANRMMSSYYYYKTNQFYKANKALNDLSRLCFDSKEFLNYYLVEFNNKHIDVVKKNSLIFNDEAEELSKDKKRESKDLDNLNLELPVSERRKPVFIQEILSFNFVYSNLHKNRELLRKILKTKELTEQGGWSSGPELSNIYNNTYNFWSLVNNNYLMVEHYNEVKSIYNDFLESMLINYSIKFPQKENGIGITTYKIPNFDAFTLFILVSKINTKELNNLFTRYEIEKLEVDTKANEYILNSFENFIISYTDKKVIKFYESEFDRILNNFLLLFSLMDFNAEDLVRIFNGISELIKNKVNYDFYKFFETFLVSLKKKEILLDSNIILNVFQSIIQKYINDNLGNYEQDAIKKSLVFFNLNELANKDSNSSMINAHLLSYLLEKVNFLIIYNIEEALNIINSFVLPLNGLVDRLSITTFLNNIFHNLNIDQLSEDANRLLLVVIHNALIDNIIEFNSLINGIYIQILSKLPGNKDILKLINRSIRYLIKEKIILSEIPKELWSVISNDSYDYFMLLPEFFNYDKFNIEWLLSMQKYEHEIFSKVAPLKIKIEEYVQNEDYISLKNELLCIIIKYYLT
jgi:NAD-dependent SIR2 family protein deacetylase